MESDQNVTSKLSEERFSNPLANNKYIKVNLALPHLVKDADEENEPYLSRLFKGRINRRNYFFGTLYVIITPLAGLLILYLNSFLLTSTITANAPLSGDISDNTAVIPDFAVIIQHIITPFGIFFVFAGAIIGLPFLISLQIRRLHDLNSNGKIALFLLIPLVTPFMLLLLLIWPGTNGANSYGVQPLAKILVRKDIFKLYDYS